jgi:hypothetical protein
VATRTWLRTSARELWPGVQGREPGATKDGGRLEVEDEQGGVELERREEGTVTWDLVPSRKTKEWSELTYG